MTFSKRSHGNLQVLVVRIERKVGDWQGDEKLEDEFNRKDSIDHAIVDE